MDVPESTGDASITSGPTGAESSSLENQNITQETTSDSNKEQLNHDVELSSETTPPHNNDEKNNSIVDDVGTDSTGKQDQPGNTIPGNDLAQQNNDYYNTDTTNAIKGLSSVNDNSNSDAIKPKKVFSESGETRSHLGIDEAVTSLENINKTSETVAIKEYTESSESAKEKDAAELSPVLSESHIAETKSNSVIDSDEPNYAGPAHDVSDKNSESMDAIQTKSISIESPAHSINQNDNDEAPTLQADSGTPESPATLTRKSGTKGVVTSLIDNRLIGSPAHSISQIENSEAPTLQADSDTMGRPAHLTNQTVIRGKTPKTDSDTKGGPIHERGGDVVLVTGGCGFLGQHIVKMLQLRSPHVSEIRVLDKIPFTQKLDYKGHKPVRSLVGSVSDSKFVSTALAGVHSVIHVAGLISFGTFPDYAGMEETNVIGTVNVFNACLRNNVQRLTYCSTVDVAIGHQPVEGGDEGYSTPVPPTDGFLFPGYPETKYQGERVVINSERVNRQDGKKLQTVILRANVLYGELDTSYVINGLRVARQNKGVLTQIGDGTAMFQQAYAGNTAWAFICADMAMRNKPDLTGEAFYVPDNTPVQNTFNFMRPYLEARGFRLSDNKLSYPLIHGIVRVAEVLARGLSPIYKVDLPTQACSVAYINTSLYFSGQKAKTLLNYEPIFTPVQARQACLEYYKTVDLN